MALQENDLVTLIIVVRHASIPVILSLKLADQIIRQWQELVNACKGKSPKNAEALDNLDFGGLYGEQDSFRFWAVRTSEIFGMYITGATPEERVAKAMEKMVGDHNSGEEWKQD